MICPIGKTNFRREGKVFGILTDDRRRHVYLIGKTGQGKSVLLENMIISDIRNGNGACVIDPHGDLAERTIKAIPSDRINDVIYFNPADTQYPIAFNPMDDESPERRHLIVSGIMSVFEKIFFNGSGFASQAPQLTHILRHTLFAIMEVKPATIMGVKRMLTEESYRKKVVDRITDPVIKQFWTVEFPQNILKRRDDPLASTLNKIGQFLTVPLLRNILGQPKSAFNLRESMDNRKILICNLSKGRIGEDSSALLGSLLITMIYLAAMSRVDIPESERNDFFLYADEFQNFATDSFANILSESRKYHLCLTLANQYIDQLPESIRNAIFGNCGTIVSFRVGANDSEILEKEMIPFKQTDFVNLDKYNIYLKMSINGVTSDAFSATTLPPCDLTDSCYNEEKVIRNSRQRYCKTREQVEDKMAKWNGI